MAERKFDCRLTGERGRLISYRKYGFRRIGASLLLCVRGPRRPRLVPFEARNLDSATMASSPTPDDMEATRKRLRFRSWHRGTKELDLIFGPFADACLADLDGEWLDRYEAILLGADLQVYDWITGRAPVPTDQDRAMIDLISKFHNDRQHAVD